MEAKTTDEDEISLREIIVKLKGYRRFLLSKWKILFLGAISCAVLGMLLSIIYKPKYLATTSMVLQSNKSMSSMLSGALALASQFGLGGGASNEEDKIVDIIVSKKIVAGALLSTAIINQKNDCLINHYLEIYEYREKLDDDERLRGLAYTPADLFQLTYLQDSILNEIHEELIEKKRLAVEKDNKSNVITIMVKTRSEEFSKYFSEKIVDAVSKFYIDNTTKNLKITLDVIQKTVDSTYQALTEAEDRYARWKDASSRLIKMQGSIEELRLRRNVEVLSAVYTEGVKNLEITKFALLNQTPVLEIIDKPHLALERKEIKMIIAIPAGFVLGIIFSCGYLLLKKIIDDSLSNSELKQNTSS